MGYVNASRLLPDGIHLAHIDVHHPLGNGVHRSMCIDVEAHIPITIPSLHSSMQLVHHVRGIHSTVLHEGARDNVQSLRELVCVYGTCVC